MVRDALTCEKSITEMVDRVAETNCNMIFVQVSGRGDAYYESTLLPKAEPDLQQDTPFDPLENVIKNAHGRGLEVHAWINVFCIWSAPELPRSPQHIIYLHPEWIAYTSEGRSLLAYERPHPFGVEGIFLSPGHPAVRVWIADIIGEIVDHYDVDGIHLDYVRYPNGETGLNPEARARFLEAYDVDPIHLFTSQKDREHNAESEDIDTLHHVWNQWRCQQVTETIQGVRDRISRAKPRVKLSAAVKPDYELAVEKYGQDWKTWMDRSLLDFVVIMAYSPETDVVARQIEDACQLVSERSLFAGIGVYNQSAFTTVRQIATVRELGLHGISLFSYNSIQDDEVYFRTVMKDCFQGKAAVPFSNPHNE